MTIFSIPNTFTLIHNDSFYNYSPTIGKNVFSKASVNIDITIDTYSSDSFDIFNVTEGKTIDACLPYSLTYIELETLPNTLFEFLTFINLHIFKVPFLSDEALSNSITLTYSLSHSKIMSVFNSTQFKSFSTS